MRGEDGQAERWWKDTRSKPGVKDIRREEEEAKE